MNILNKSEIIDDVVSQEKQTDKFLREDLERYYIDEKKSISEISNIYDCDWSTIKRKLKKHGISIRPHGAFTMSDDGESLYSKYIKGEISILDYKNDLVKNKGYVDFRDYSNDRLKKRGYTDVNEYNRKLAHDKGINLPMSENKKCSKYLGVYICENKEFLSKIINILESMPENNPGYDIICIKNKKVDVKCACLIRNKEWNFTIDKNKIADYFLMIAFDNRENLGVMHIWLVKSDVVIEKTKNCFSKSFVINEKDVINIGKGNIALKRWIKHEITDAYKLEEVQKVCDNFKNNNIIN